MWYITPRPCCTCIFSNWIYIYIYLYWNYEKYPLSPLKPKILALIQQYLPNISDPVYSVHQSFRWFLWLNWRKSTFYPVMAPSDSKCWPIVTSSIQEPAASNCDVTMTDFPRVVTMGAFLTQWFNEFVRDPYVPSFSTLWKTFVKPFCEAAKCLASDVMRAGIIIGLFTKFNQCLCQYLRHLE